MQTSNLTKNKPIGVFDSGVGGLSVLREIKQVLPNEDVIYVGDNEFFPYGKKTFEQISDRVVRVCRWLINQNCKAIVIACNTATEGGLLAAQEELGDRVPIIGVIEPGAAAAVKATKTGKIGILATQLVVDYHSYSKTIQNYDPKGFEEFKVTETAAPDLVEFVENSFFGGNADTDHNDNSVKGQQIMERYTKDFKAAGVDTVVMGCTHFPLAQNFLAQSMGSEVTLVSPSYETALKLQDVLSKKDELTNSNNGHYEFYASGFTDKTTQKFQDVASVLFENIPSIVKEAIID